MRAQLLLLPTALGSFISAPITASRRTVPARTWILLGLAFETLGLIVVGAVLYPSAPPTATQRSSIVTAISRGPADPSAAGRALATVTAQQKAGISTATTASLAWGTRWAALLAALPIAAAWYLSRRLPRSRKTPAPRGESARAG